MPTSETAQIDFTPQSGSDNALMVDDYNDDDTTYVGSSTVGHIDRYNLGNTTSGVTGIAAIQTTYLARKTDVDARTMRSLIKSGTTTTNAATETLSASYQHFETIIEENPDTTSAWTKTTVDALEVGLEVVS